MKRKGLHKAIFFEDMQHEYLSHDQTRLLDQLEII